ncbi:MAG: peptide chain release factor N(5)-glutamine methyltransferase [Myxococcota bacterium]
MTDERSGSRRWTSLEVLDWTRGHFERKGLDSPRLDAEVLLAHVLDTQRVMLYARFDQPLHADELARMRELVARRAAGAPVAHLVGKREFWSLPFEVSPDVLIPRPETEHLVEVARRRKPEAKVIVDVGTGSGAVAVALARELPEAEVHATELSPAAAEVARRNVAQHAPRVQVHVGSLLESLPEDLDIDLLVANLPYIPSREIEILAEEVRDHDPHLALDGGPDGLVSIRALVADAPSRLTEGAVLALESGPEQVPSLRRLLEAGGFVALEVEKDLAGRDRVTSARLPSS